ncbi:class I SAM-dependent methyltransferase [Rhodococcus triatomae]|nr:ubiquinone/menaquinone biosynthesis methyltransferase [Rhodococcus triatomae BKS 15-14]
MSDSADVAARHTAILTGDAEDPDGTTEALGRVFDAGAREFDRLTPTLWGPAGQALAFQLRLRPGDTVLDVCCGAGASAIPAAAAVGPTGLVHAVDVADELLELGRVAASDRALRNVDFVRADATRWEPPSNVPRGRYDVLSCSYGIFFLPHPNMATARLLRLLRPVSRVGVTVWRRGALDDVTGAYFDAVARHVPDAARPIGPSALADFDTPDALRAWLSRFGAASVEVNELSNLIPLSPEFAWDLVLGSALRGPLLSLAPEVVEAVRLEYLSLLTERDVEVADAGTLVATAVVVR